MRLIFPVSDIERVSFENEDVVTVNVHGLSRKMMTRLLKNISCMNMQAFTLRVIHGFNHGTALKETVRREGLFSRAYKIVGDKTNPGVTMIVFA